MIPVDMPQGKRATNLISSPANSSQLKDSQEDALGIDSSHTLPDASKTEEESLVVCQYHTGTLFVLHCLFFNIYVAEIIKFDFLLHFPAP